MGAAGEQFDSGDQITPARMNQKTITADTGANCTADTKYAGKIFMPSSSNGSFVADNPAFILPSDGTTVKQFTTADNTQTLTNKTLTSPTLTTPTVTSGTFTTPRIISPNIEWRTRIALPLPAVFSMYGSGGTNTEVIANAAGYIDMATDTATGDDAYIFTHPSITPIRGDRTFELNLLISVVQTATTEIEVGVSNDTSAAALMTSSEVHATIVYDASTSANWIARNANAGGGGNQTSTTSAVAVTTGLHQLTIINKESSIEFYVDGTIIATHSTNLPTTTTMAMIAAVQTETTASKSLYFLGGTLYIDAT